VTRSIHRSAAEDLAQATRFYKQEAGAGLARRFLAEFERIARLLEEYPELGTPTADQRRSFLLADFPYSVIYRRDSGGIRILVVRHQSRDPGFGEGRR
jgi:plasmid stabilization system protein ParE